MREECRYGKQREAPNNTPYHTRPGHMRRRPLKRRPLSAFLLHHITPSPLTTATHRRQHPGAPGLTHRKGPACSHAAAPLQRASVSAPLAPLSCSLTVRPPLAFPRPALFPALFPSLPSTPYSLGDLALHVKKKPALPLPHPSAHPHANHCCGPRLPPPFFPTPLTLSPLFCPLLPV